MAEIDKAINVEEQLDLQVRNRTKGVDVEVDVTEENPETGIHFEQTGRRYAFAFGKHAPHLPVDDTDFSANLADAMDDSDLNSLKNDLMGNVEDDKEFS